MGFDFAPLKSFELLLVSSQSGDVGEVRRWNSLQNVNRDVALLKHYLVGLIKADLRQKRQAAPAPLFETAEG